MLVPLFALCILSVEEVEKKSAKGMIVQLSRTLMGRPTCRSV